MPDFNEMPRQFFDRIAFGAIWLLIFVIPMENIVVIEGIGTVSRLIGALCMVFACVAFMCRRQGIGYGPLNVMFAIFLFWSLATCLWTIDLTRSSRAIWSLIQLFLFAWLVWNFGRLVRRQAALLKAYVLGGYVASVSTLYAFVVGTQSTYMRYSAQGFDPNDLGLTLALGVPMAWSISLSEQEKTPVRWISAGFIPLALLAILLTASRAAFVALTLAMCYVLLTWRDIPRKAKALPLLLAPLFLWGVYRVVPSYSWSRISTISAEIGAGTLNSRATIWRDGLDALAHSPILGTGVGTFPAALENHAGYAAASHNLFLSIVVGQGFVGLILFFALLLASFRQIGVMMRANRLLWTAMLITWMAGVMTLSWEVRKPTWLLLALIANQAAIDYERRRANRLPSSLRPVPG